ncbi:MAG: HEAT repeat domain-containing protein [Myxococcota bacterium]
MRLPLTSLLLVACGCSRDATIRVGEIQVFDRTGAASAEWRLEGEVLRGLVKDALRGPQIEVAEGSAAGAPWRCRVELAIEGAVVAGHGVLRAAIAARLDRPGVLEETPIEASAVVERGFESFVARDRTALVRAHLARGLRDALADIHREVRLRLGDGGGLKSALGESDPAVRRIAVRVAELRRERAVVPRLIELLRDADATVADAAIGALAAIGDRRAVRPLCDLVPLRDVRGVAKILDAVGAIGGDEARAYLEYVAAGHDDPEVRSLAKEARGRLLRRARGER